MITILLMEHFNSILFHKFGPANKQLTINQSMGAITLKKKNYSI